ncbi:MAG: hypothetical protein A2086_09700 [Spirochaetes bacterium GWD1_27_9]|nr:MAG: hypothetical protein A2Z98_11930 [Spirochaetes bacterium GWB1_27_13]OHD20442.1 MAG: hypothetical protein A2Y34_02040 [Spirochaetes bacterium GWC1_27_15]OHD32018.1 MAG: hypothetical protein A2086_09700 [Spirochaetes bacterium GWD1_27_9]
MNINTGKLVSNSELLLKKVKEQDTNNKVVQKTENDIPKEKLLKDFADIKFNDNNFKSRIMSNNNRLSTYENELSKIQFIEQKLSIIETAQQGNNTEEISKIINESIFNNEQILKNHFKSNDNLQNDISNLKDVISNSYENLNKEFKAIEIASQNIISTNSKQFNMVEESIQNIGSTNLLNTFNLSNKRVMELIS